MIIVGFGFVVFIWTFFMSANMDPTTYSHADNVIFFGTARPAFVFLCMMIATGFFMLNHEVLKNIMCNTYLAAWARMMLIFYLIHLIVLMFLAGTPN